MAKNRYYYYDHDKCCFVEVHEKRSRFVIRTIAVINAVLLTAVILTLAMDRFVQTPQELALLDENAALRVQLTDVSNRISVVSDELAKLNDTDQHLYRTLLEAEPLDEDIRQVGVGGSDPFPEFGRFSPTTSALLTSTAEKIDRLEQQIGLQSSSYRELMHLATDRELALAQMPAISPTDGPVVSGYGLRFHPILKVKRMHQGLDFHAPRGTPVVSTGDGVVKKIGKGSGLGNFVKIEHAAAGYVTVYGHLSRIREGLRRGMKVKRGELIAFSGNTGLTSAPHLHYEVRDLNGRTLNPVFFLAPSMTPTAYRKLFDQAQNSVISLD